MTWIISFACAVGTLVAIVLFVTLYDWLCRKDINIGVVVAIIVYIVLNTFIWHMAIFG